MKVAIVHYWWFKTRGGEKVLLELLKIFPEADLYLHCGSKDLINQERIKIRHKGNLFFSFVNKIPFINKFYQIFFMIMPFASETFNFDGYDVIISSESGPAKNIITPVESVHICYCHSPMRYIWDLNNQYLSSMSRIKKLCFIFISYFARKTDFLSSNRVDFFISNSSFVKKRIMKFYKKESTVIFPPVDTQKFYLSKKKDFFIFMGELIEYKKPDIAIEAFNKLKLPLYVIGDGAMIKKLKKHANSNITFLGRLDDLNVTTYLSEANALIYPGIEDFGIIPIEAMASGTPVIAFNAGGAKDYVENFKTGLLFNDQNSNSLVESVLLFNKNKHVFDSAKIKQYAEAYSSKKFKTNIKSFIRQKVSTR